MSREELIKACQFAKIWGNMKEQNKRIPIQIYKNSHQPRKHWIETGTPRSVQRATLYLIPLAPVLIYLAYKGIEFIGKNMPGAF